MVDQIDLSVVAALAWLGLLLFHGGTIVAAVLQPLATRLRGTTSRRPAVRAVVPMFGLEPELATNLTALIEQDYPDLGIDFCFGDKEDAAVAVACAVAAAAPLARQPRFLFGETPDLQNAKARNEYRALAEADAPLVFIMDSNAQIAAGHLAREASLMQEGVGLVSTLPLGVRPQNFLGRIDCAVLNAYNARFHLAMSTVGFEVGFGKAMLIRWTPETRRAIFENFRRYSSEDSAIVFAMRELGLRLVLCDKPAEHPVGAPSWTQLWGRYARWARYRRLYMSWNIPIEALCGAWATALCGWFAGAAFSVQPWTLALAGLGLRYIGDAAFLSVKGWRFGPMDVAAWVCRDVLLPAIWIRGYVSRPVAWKGGLLHVRPTPKN